ncbi:hypothetical protein LQ953_13390 [Sphingomonas sp. IC-56]|uniref:hypothetical protein n=1 Tax=Sphingomonas sp. IC-56 TaxID=2898529 RepID=UPI001E3631D4|nr:hypothetical protein [Sphingomonas sp. IC-56]MCD2325012.1 hypothetical protein [Sphingomonas sp. IC-56]
MATAFKHAAQPLPFIHPDDMPPRYALPGIGHCLEPLVKNGTLVAFDKERQPEPGNIVGLIFTREAAKGRGVPGMIKRLAMALPPTGLPKGCSGLVVVEQINPPRRYHIPVDELLAVHAAYGFAESAGDGRAMVTPFSKETGL